MLNLGSLCTWLFHGGKKCKQEESETEANRDVLPKSSGVQRQRYAKIIGSVGCVFLGLVLFILLTVGYVALTAELSQHLWKPTFEYWEGGKNWHRGDHSVRSSRQTGNGLPRLRELGLPVLSSHEIEFSLRANSPKDEGYTPVRMFIDPHAQKGDKKPVRFPDGTTDQQQQFRAARTMEQVHFPKELVNPAQTLVHERRRESTEQVAGRSMSDLRRPNRRIPVLQRDRLSRGYKRTLPQTDAFNEHHEVRR